MTVRNWDIERFTNLEPGVRSYRIEHCGCVASIEVSARAVWIDYIETEPAHGRKGAASRVITMLIQYCARRGKLFVPGTYSNEGKSYVKPLVDRLCEQLNVHIAN